MQTLSDTPQTRCERERAQYQNFQNIKTQATNSRGIWTETVPSKIWTELTRKSRRLFPRTQTTTLWVTHISRGTFGPDDGDSASIQSRSPDF